MIVVTDCAQGSMRWEEHRRGRPTGSGLRSVVNVGNFKPAAGARDYCCRLVASSLGGIKPSLGSKAMQLGIQLEENARCSYEFDTDSEVEQVAFVHDESGKWGFSPDGLVGTDGGVEIKVPQLDTHLKYLDMAVIPVEYRAQVWAPLLMGWQWWDFYSYSRFESVPHFLIRAHAHDEDFIAWKAAMGEYFPQFLERLDAMRHSVGLGPLDHPTDKHLERYDGSTSIDTTSVTMFEGHAVTYW